MLLTFFVALAEQANAQFACLPIHKVALSGITLFPQETQNAWVKPYEGRCLGVPEFEQILETVTTAYIDEGFILARAYLPEQDLLDKTLDIAVIEGSLSEVTINGEQDSRWAKVVFPDGIGEPVQLRKVEQGLDTIQDMPRYTAEMEFDAGEEVGESVLHITAKTEKPTEFTMTTNNRGDKGAGLWITGFSGDTTNLLGVNDTLSFGVTRSLDPNPFSFGYKGDQNRSANMSFEMPYGITNYTVSANWSDYNQTIPGSAAPIAVNGSSYGFGFKAKRLMHRDQETKSYLSFDLTLSDSKNYIAGVLIAGSSRRLMSARLTYSHERPWKDGQLAASVYAEQGLPFFGAEKASDQPAEQPNAQHFLIGGEVTYGKTYAMGNPETPIKLKWDSTLKGQLSADRLYGGQQFSIGGMSTVRGSRIALTAGSSGVVWRNEVSYISQAKPNPVFGKFEPYYAIDFGHVIGQSDLSVTGGNALGHVIGLRTVDGPLEIDLSYQEIITTSSHLQQPDGEVFVSLSYTF